MISEKTFKQLNASEIALGLLEEAGVSKCTIAIIGVPDEDVKHIAMTHKTEFHKPTYMNPEYWCVITKGVNSIIINGTKKSVRLIEVFE